MPSSVLRFFSPSRLIIGSLLAMIPCAMALLALPCCRTVPLNLLDLFFMAVSYATISGFEIIPLSSFSFLGHIVILILMQIGGIGLITLSFYFISFFIELGIGAQIVGAKLLSLNSWSSIGDFIFFIIKLTLIIECLGAIGIFIAIYPDYPVGYALFLSFFHAVSAFASAGLVLFDKGLPAYHNNFLLLGILSFLMIAGEIGFIVWYEITEWVTAYYTKKKFHFSLHSKIIFLSTIGITLISFLTYWLLERCTTLHGLTFASSLVTAIFNSIAARGTGFSLCPMISLQLASLVLIMVLTFIGASPGSTGSGVKTTSITLLGACIKATIYGKPSTVIRGRTIASMQVYQAVSIVSLSLMWILGALFVLLMTQTATFIELLFEVVSAFGNCGLSLGITNDLSSFGKIIIALTMMVGRVGWLVIFLALRRKYTSVEYSYPEEKIMIG